MAASNLLKCAIAGNDPNWGRVVSSLGTVPETVAPYDPNRVTVDINGVRICDGGKPGRDRSEVDMTPREVHIDIDLNALVRKYLPDYKEAYGYKQIRLDWEETGTLHVHMNETLAAIRPGR